MGGQGLHLVSWCCQSIPHWRDLAPLVHGVGWDGHGRGHEDGRDAHGELTVDRVVDAGAPPLLPWVPEDPKGIRLLWPTLEPPVITLLRSRQSASQLQPSHC